MKNNPITELTPPESQQLLAVENGEVFIATYQNGQFVYFRLDGEKRVFPADSWRPIQLEWNTDFSSLPKNQRVAVMDFSGDISFLTCGQGIITEELQTDFQKWAFFHLTE